MTRFERDGDLGVVVIDDPPLNLFGRELTKAVFDAVGEAQRAGVRALLIRAEGDVFTGGADVHVFTEQAAPVARVRAADGAHPPARGPADPTLACVHAASRPASSSRSPAT